MTTPDPLALAAVEAYCGWDPTEVVTNRTTVLDGNGKPLIALPTLALTNVTSVTVLDRYGNTYSPALPSEVSWSADGTLSWHVPGWAQVWPAGDSNITVVWSGGYPEPPAYVQAAIDSLTKRMPQIQSGALSQRSGSFSVSYAQAIAAGGMLAIEQMVLDRYRIPKVR